MKLGISPDNLTKEGRALQRAGLDRFDEVVIIDPHKTGVAFMRDGIRVFHGGEDISDLYALIVRRTYGAGAASGILSRALSMCGCKTVDPHTRYSVGYSSKITTSITRFANGVGSEVFYAFDFQSANNIIDLAKAGKRKPFIVKPVDGSHSRGKIVIKTVKRLREIADEFFSQRRNSDYPFFFQPFEDIHREFRVILVDGYPITVIEKIKNSHTARGSAFVVPHDAREVEKFAAESCSDEGIVGADIAILADGRKIVIEENRAPGFDRVARVTGVDIASSIIDEILV